MFVIKDVTHKLYYSSSNGLKMNLVKLNDTTVCLFGTKAEAETEITWLRSNLPNKLEISEVELIEK